MVHICHQVVFCCWPICHLNSFLHPSYTNAWPPTACSESPLACLCSVEGTSQGSPMEALHPSLPPEPRPTPDPYQHVCKTLGAFLHSPFVDIHGCTTSWSNTCYTCKNKLSKKTRNASKIPCTSWKLKALRPPLTTQSIAKLSGKTLLINQVTSRPLPIAPLSCVRGPW